MEIWAWVSLALVWGAPLVSGLLGAGEGPGSCLAPPFRAEPESVAWPEGCPAWAPCCSEYGFCQTRSGASCDQENIALNEMFRETWEDGTLFRDCNGESNGLELPLRTLQAELVEKNAGREVAGDDLLGLEGLVKS